MNTFTPALFHHDSIPSTEATPFTYKPTKLFSLISRSVTVLAPSTPTLSILVTSPIRIFVADWECRSQLLFPHLPPHRALYPAAPSPVLWSASSHLWLLLLSPSSSTTTSSGLVSFTMEFFPNRKAELRTLEWHRSKARWCRLLEARLRAFIGGRLEGD